MKTTTKVILVFAITAILGGSFGLLMTLPTSEASTPNTTDISIQSEGCTIEVTGDFRSLDLFNQFEDQATWDGSYKGKVLEHCVYVNDERKYSFTSYKGRADSGYSFLFQLIGKSGETYIFYFYASSGHEYEIKFWLWEPTFGTYTITVNLYVA